MNDGHNMAPAIVDKPPRDRRLLNYAELLQQPSIEWLIPQKLQALALNVLFGASETCKTLIAIYWTLIVAQQHSVIIVAGEGLYGLAQRIEAAADYFQLSTDNLYVWTEPIRLMEPKKIVQAFVNYAAVVKPKLVVIDTLARCMAGGNENGPDMIVATETCGLIQKLLVSAVLLLHHSPRGATHERGHVSLRGAADIMIRTERPNKGPIVILSCEKTKDSEPFVSERFRLIKHLRSVVLSVDGAVSGNKLKILQALDQPAALAKLVAATKIPRATLLRLLAQLKKSGHVRQPTSKGAYERTAEGSKAALGTSKTAKSQGLRSDQSKVRLQKSCVVAKSQNVGANHPSANVSNGNGLDNAKSQVSLDNSQSPETETPPSLKHYSVYRTESETGVTTQFDDEEIIRAERAAIESEGIGSAWAGGSDEQ